MANDLDDILLSTDCPKCGATISFTYKQVRTFKAVACGCGALLKVQDDTPIAALQRLIDDENPPEAEND